MKCTRWLLALMRESMSTRLDREILYCALIYSPDKLSQAKWRSVFKNRFLILQSHNCQVFIIADMRIQNWNSVLTHSHPNKRRRGKARKRETLHSRHLAQNIQIRPVVFRSVPFLQSCLQLIFRY